MPASPRSTYTEGAPLPKTKTKTKSKRSTPPRSKRVAPAPRDPGYRLHRSAVDGTGLFATRAFTKGDRVIEYVGEHISHEEADRRHAQKAADDSHTFLFTIDANTVIDAGVRGNDSRFINHSCDPNCEVILVDGRPLVEVLRAVRQGEELAYDYNLTREPEDPPEIEVVFACRCGASICRGSMLATPRKPKAVPTSARLSNATVNAKAKAKARAEAEARAKADAKAKARAKAKRSAGRRHAAA